MIGSWRNAASRKVWEGERPNQFRGLDFEATMDLFLALNAAKTLRDLSPLRSVGLHKLKGDRAGQWAMTVWTLADLLRVPQGRRLSGRIVDYHKG